MIKLKDWCEHTLSQDIKVGAVHVVGLTLVDGHLHSIFDSLDFHDALGLHLDLDVLGQLVFSFLCVDDFEADLADSDAGQRVE